jgi:hypothetical protein
MLCSWWIVPEDEGYMISSRILSHLTQAVVSVIMLGTACAATPIVKPTRTISWDPDGAEHIAVCLPAFSPPTVHPDA